MNQESPTGRVTRQRLLSLFRSRSPSLLGAVCLPLGALLLMPACKPSCETLRTCPKPGGLAGDSGTGGLAGDSGAGGKDQDGQKGSGGTSSGGMSGGGTSGSAGSEPPECVPGEFLASADDPLVCEPCSSGTFSTKKNAASCSVWKACDAGNQVAVDGTAKSDRECEPCPAETFSSQKNQEACAAWTACAPGYVEAAAGSPTADRVCSLVEWMRQFGTSTSANAAALDTKGNIIVAGRTSVALEGSMVGVYDAYVRVLSPTGEVVWTRQFGAGKGTGDGAYAVAVDSKDNIIVVGETNGALQGEHAGGSDAYVRVFSSDGDILWTRQFGAEFFDYAYAVAVDGGDNVIVVGSVNGVLQGATGSGPAFVRVFTSGGDVLWTRQFGEGLGSGASVAVDSSGNVIVAGGGNVTAFVQVFSPSGAELWTRPIDSLGLERAFAVTVDSRGNIIVAGTTDGALQGENAGGYDAYVRVFSPDGSLLWTRQFGTSSDDRGDAVAVDDNGNIILAGGTDGTLQGESAGAGDAFVRAYSPSGDVLWTHQFGGSGDDSASAVLPDGGGNLIVAGGADGEAFVTRLGDRTN